MAIKPKFVETGEKHLVKQLARLLEWADSASFCVSYARYQAFKMLERSFTTFLKRGGRLRLVFDIERYFTDPEVITEFSTIPGNSECRVFFRASNPQNVGPLHSKVYLFRKSNKVRVILGSSNFTLGGLTKNLEGNVLLEGAHTEAFFKEIIDFFERLWDSPNSIRPSQKYDLIEVYEKFIRENKKNQVNESKQEKVRQRVIRQVLVQAQKEFQSLLRSDTSYLLGLVAGGGFVKNTNTIIIKYHKGVFNRGLKDEGYITARGISDFKIKQRDAFSKDVTIIANRLTKLFKTLQTKDSVSIETKSDFDYEIAIVFEERSKLFQLIKEYVDACNIVRGRIVPIFPQSLKDATNELVASFLHGYCDVRVRIRPTDREGMTGPLRVAISFSKGAELFAKELDEIFKKRFGIKHRNLLPGGPRGRETMLRIDPVDLTQMKQKIFSANSWKLALIKDFTAYNKRLFPKRY